MRHPKLHHSLHIHRATLLAVAFGLAGAACDTEDGDLADADLSADSEAADPADPGDTYGGDLAAAPDSSAAPLPIFTIAPPYRVEDLPKNHYPQIRRDTDGGAWHDFNIVRDSNDAGNWDGHQDDYAGEQDDLDWDMPVYAGVDGEVLSCWRNSPYDIAYQPTQQHQGGNFMVIRTDDDRYIYYAHMNTDSIPAELCPNASPTGWTDPTVMMPGSNITVAAYVPPANRAQISVGQYIGRMGAHGNAGGPHLHMHSGDVTTNPAGVETLESFGYELDFADVWHRPAENGPNGTPWTFATPGAIPTAARAAAVQLWPAYKHEATFSQPPHLGQFNQTSGGLDDALCHNVGAGGLWLDYADVGGGLAGTDTNNGGTTFCTSLRERLHKGDFDGDGRQDLLCHNLDSGSRSVRYANTSGNFSGVTTFSESNAWCHLERQDLHVGDFDGDGRDDLLCHNTIDGFRHIDRAEPFTAANARQMPFSGTDVPVTNAWCENYYQRLHIGDFNGDGRDDLLCHHTRNGNLYVDHSSGTGLFDVTDFSMTGGNWCNQGGERMYVGEFTADGRDDVLCHDGDDGDLEIRAAQANIPRFLPTSTWKRDNSGFCVELQQRLHIGQIGGDVRDDLLCHDRKSGLRFADHMTPITGLTTGGFGNTDWSELGGWCTTNTQALH